ncbi:MAG: FAD-dependent oxidoreductase [Lachnospiraceae bacterium]|nr:FAD-dependent oxidoreductase [Lachnospiraceae bacterium]
MEGQNLNKVKILILGAGPSGLVLGRCLHDRGEKDFLILEKEKEAGGLCRSLTVDGAPFDIGGGHFLDAKNRPVCDLLFRFLPEEEWNLYERDSRIRIHGMEISHPLEANLYQLPETIRNEYLESIRIAGCNTGEKMPERFTEWIRWKLGDRIAEDYMLPYNRKLFADTLNDLGTYWLHKLPNVSYEETLRSVREHQSYGTQPGHARFYYPKKYGYGEVFRRIAESIDNKVRYDSSVIFMDAGERLVRCADGSEYRADLIVTTIPWNSFETVGLSPDVKEGIKKLRSSSIETRYVQKSAGSKAHWLYIPDETLPYHRILCRENFAPGSRGYWVETRAERCGSYRDEEGGFAYMNEYAYPLNTIGKPMIMERLLKEAGKRKILGIGRWGKHSHDNSDTVMEAAMKLAVELMGNI